jgi:hypothetical protein
MESFPGRGGEIFATGGNRNDRAQKDQDGVPQVETRFLFSFTIGLISVHAGEPNRESNSKPAKISSPSLAIAGS